VQGKQKQCFDLSKQSCLMLVHIQNYTTAPKMIAHTTAKRFDILAFSTVNISTQRTSSNNIRLVYMTLPNTTITISSGSTKTTTTTTCSSRTFYMLIYSVVIIVSEAHGWAASCSPLPACPMPSGLSCQE
jgi:hypothetical protein